MKSFDFCIVGNIFLDTVQATNSFQVGVSNLGLSTKTDLGGVMNTARGLCEIDKKYKVFVSTVVGNDKQGSDVIERLQEYKNKNPNFDYHVARAEIPTTNAFIICETEEQRRSSIVNWGACKISSDFILPKSKWYHFMYLDTLLGVDKKMFTQIPETSIISADFCLAAHSSAERKRIMNLVRNMNFVITSDDSATSVTGEQYEIYAAMSLGESVGSAAIVHSPRGSFVSAQGNDFMVSSEYINDVKLDVLGAGDAFAAGFMHSTQKDPNNIKKNVEYAHASATDFIQGVK